MSEEFVRVFFLDGEEAFIVYVCGKFTIANLEEIECEINENYADYCDGASDGIERDYRTTWIEEDDYQGHFHVELEEIKRTPRDPSSASGSDEPLSLVSRDDMLTGSQHKEAGAFAQPGSTPGDGGPSISPA